MTVMLLALLLQDPDPKQVDDLVLLLRSENAAAREAAVTKLLAMGEKALPLLEKYEKSDEAELRARVAQVAFRLRPWTMDPVAAAAKSALKEGSKLEDWRPALKALLAKLVDELGADIAQESKRDADKVLTKCFEDGMKISRENAAALKRDVFLLAKAEGDEVDRGALLVCESASYDKIDDSIVLCLGNVNITSKLQKSIVIATGRVTLSGEAKNSIVVCAGEFTIGDKVRDCTVVASGGCVIGGESKECVFVNTKATLGGKSDKNHQVEKSRLPKAGK